MRYLTNNATVMYAPRGQFEVLPVNVTHHTPPSSVCVYTQEENDFLIFSNGIPSHVAPPDLEPTIFLFELPRFPKIAFDRARPEGMVGITVSGVPLNNSKRSAAPQDPDECGGTVDASGRYMYIDVPTCIDTPRTKGFIGYALDGFPIYTTLDHPEAHADIQMLERPFSLDECNGYVGTDGAYRYVLNPTTIHASGTFLPCFRGHVPLATLESLQTPSTLDDVAAIQGTGLMSSHVNLQTLKILPRDLSSVWLNRDNVAITTSATTVTVMSTGLPSRDPSSYGPFPNPYNSHHVKPQQNEFHIPRTPTWLDATTPLPSGAIGVMINGVPFYNTVDMYGNSLLDPRILRHLVLDKCNGYVDASGAYRYYAPPDCLLDALHEARGKPSPLIGYAFDGYPVYGRYGANGQVPLDLDACNGRWDEDGYYRYHVTDAPPYTLGCFHGVVPPPANIPFYRSLSSSSAITIDPSVPYIMDITTRKAPGTSTVLTDNSLIVSHV
jgi:hypothetical protein